MENEVTRVIKTRRSVREYSEEKIPYPILVNIVDCGRHAPSGRGEFPVEFILVTDRTKLFELSNMLDHGKFVRDARAAVVVIARDVKYYLEDGSAATENILLAAWSYQIASCWIAGDKKEYADRVLKYFNVPSGYKLVSIVSLGYPKGKIKDKPRPSLAKVLHKEQY